MRCGAFGSTIRRPLRGIRAAGRAAAANALAPPLHIPAGMGRLFLSAQTTCALLLGAGLLLRAQAHLRAQEENAPQAAARTRPAQIISDTRGVSGRAGQAPRVVRTPASRERTATRGGKARTQGRKPMAHRARQPKRGGASVAQPNTGDPGGRR